MALFPLYVEQHVDELKVHWLDDDGAVQHGMLGDAADAAAQRDVLVLVAGETVLLTEVALPPIRQSGRRLNAAKYALEEQLAARVDTLHFALADKPVVRSNARDGTTAIAVTDLERMHALVATLTDAGLNITRIAPDVLALPEPQPGSWQACTLGKRILARTGLTTGFACDHDLWPALAGGAENEAERIIVQTDRTHDPVLPATDSAGAPTIETLPPCSSDALLVCLLGNAEARVNVNLCQGEFARRSNARSWWQPFKATAALAALWLVVLLGSRAVASYQVHQRIDALHQQTVSAFHAAFPDVQNINNLRVQAEQKIAALRGHGAGGGIYELLQATAAATTAATGISVQTLQYRSGKLILSLKGDNVQALETLRAGFKRQPGVRMTIERADAGDDGVQIRASVSPA